MHKNINNSKMMKIKSMFSNLLCGLLAIVTIWVGVFSNISSANATPLTNTSQLVAFFGKGTADEASGKVEQAVGSAQRNLGKMTGQAEGAINEAKGKVREDIGTTKNAIEDVTNRAKNKVERDIRTTKNAVNNVDLSDTDKSQEAIQESYERVETITDKAVDNVKSIFGQ
ncbi:hypothetical protein NIES4101_51420 [Calothrix sp. NIES-4101]|nr:hypothetical protein NIES4101_51420 [Calothrix sp. NIES-4101]